MARSSLPSSFRQPPPLPLFLTLAFLVIDVVPSTAASPPPGLRSLTARQQSSSTSSSNHSSSPSPSAIIATAVVSGVVVLGFVVYILMRRRRSKKVGGAGAGLPAPAASSATARAVTTTPTAGGISAEGREQAEAERERQRAINLSDARRNARAERARRQGSQRSVRSLPRYQKEVDENEMVLVKAEEGHDEYASPESESESESDSDGSDEGRRGASNSYPPRSRDNDALLGTSPGERPESITLPSHTSEPSTFTARSHSTRETRSTSVSTAGSTGGQNSNDDHAALLAHGWGEAPAYDDDGGQDNYRVTGGPPSGPPTPTPTPIAPTSSPFMTEWNRAGGLAIRRLFSFRNNSDNQQAELPLPVTFSSLAAPTTSSPAAPATRGHRPSTSISTLHTDRFGGSSHSLLLRPFNSRNSTSSMGLEDRRRLTSPSQLSISAPIQDTLVKTNFSPPKSGFTPDQMKFISSTSTLGQYAIPFGEPSRRSFDTRRRSADVQRSGEQGTDEVPPPAWQDNSSDPEGLPSSGASPVFPAEGLPTPVASLPPSPPTVTTMITTTTTNPPAIAPIDQDDEIRPVSLVHDDNEGDDGSENYDVKLARFDASLSISPSQRTTPTPGGESGIEVQIEPATPISVTPHGGGLA